MWKGLETRLFSFTPPPSPSPTWIVPGLVPRLLLPSHFELFLTFLLHRVPPHVEVIKWSQSDEANETVEILELILDGSARHCPTVVCGGREDDEEGDERRKTGRG